jgi:hypothetical protein
MKSPSKIRQRQMWKLRKEEKKMKDKNPVDYTHKDDGTEAR